MFFIGLFLANTWRKNQGSPCSFKRKGEFILLSNLVWGKPLTLCACTILFPRGRTPFGQHQESRPLARSNDIPFLNGFVNTTDSVQNRSDLSDLTVNMRRVTWSPRIADFHCWTRTEVMILGADQKERGLLRDENVHARAHVRALMTRKSCAVEMRNAILWNYLKYMYLINWVEWGGGGMEWPLYPTFSAHTPYPM